MITNYRNRGALIVNTKTLSFKLRFFKNIPKNKKLFLVIKVESMGSEVALFRD